MANPTHTAGSSGEDSAIYLSEISPQDKPWDKHRANASTVQKFYRSAQYDNYAERIDKCSRLLEFNLKPDDLGSFKLKLHSAQFCRVRHCAVCQWRRTLMWRARFFEAMPKIVAANPTAKFVFLTLTVRNCPINELRSTVTQMTKAWKRLTLRKEWPAIGFVKALEVTKGTDDLAHPHFHCILMVQPGYFTGKYYLSQAKWTELWKSCLRIEYTPVVDVRKVRSRKSDTSSEHTQALLETLKYSVKEEDLTSNPAWLIELTKQLHKTRAIAVGGVFKDYLSEDEPEDLINTESEEVEPTGEADCTIVFGWRERIAKYRQLED